MTAALRAEWVTRTRGGCMAIALVCAIGLAATGGVRVAAWALLSFAMTLAVASVLRGPLDRSFSLDLAFASLTLRWVCVASLQSILVARGHGHFVFPDERGYERVASELSRSWTGTGPPVPTTDRYVIGAFLRLVAGVMTIGGQSVFAALTVPIAFGTWTTVLVHRTIAGVLHQSISAARIGGVLASVYPTTLAWSCLLLKDAAVAWSTLAIVLTALVLSSKVDKGAVLLVLFGAGGAVFLLSERPAQAYALGIAVGLWCLWLVAKRYINSTKVIVVGIGTAAVLALGAVVAVDHNHIPRTLAYHRHAGRFHARTATIAERPPQRATWASTAAYLPHGFALVLARPYPWEASDTAERAGAVGNILFLALSVLAIAGAARRWRRRHAADVILLSGAAIAVLVLLALAEGNAGTAFRHRDTIVPMLLCLVAPVAASLWLYHRPASAAPACHPRDSYLLP